MGEYAELAIEQGLSEMDCDYDDDHYDDSDFTPHSRRQVYHHYCLNKIIRQTEKAALILFENEKGKYKGTTWSHAFWFPLSQIEIYDCEVEKRKYVMIPKWLIDVQFSQGGVEVIKENN